MADQKFNVRITSTDESGKGFDKASQRFKKFDDSVRKVSQPLDRIAKSLGGIGDSKFFGAFSKFTGVFGDLTNGAGALSSGLFDATAGLGGVGGAAAGAATGIGGLVIAVGALDAAAVNSSRKWAESNSEIQRTAETLGMSVQDLQGFRAAGEKVTVGADQMTSSLLGIGDAVNNALIGKNPDAMAALNGLHIKLKLAKDGTVDLKQAVLDLADATKRQTPYMQRQIAGIFGFTPALPVMRQGSDPIKTDIKDFAPGSLSAKQTTAAEHLQESFKTRDLRYKALWNLVHGQIAKVVAPQIDAESGAVGHLTNVLHAGFDFADSTGAPGRNAMKGVQIALAERFADWMSRKLAGPTGRKPMAPNLGAAASDEFNAFANRIEQQESGGRQFRRPGVPLVSPRGAIGVMQLLPATAAFAARQLGMGLDLNRLATDANYNRVLGRQYLGNLLKRYHGSEILAAAAYNAGVERLEGPYVDRAGRLESGWLPRIGDPRNGQISENSFASMIPFLETRNYVQNTARPGVVAEPPAQKVDVAVDVRFANAPPGLIVQTSGPGRSRISVNTGPSMPGAR